MGTEERPIFHKTRRMKEYEAAVRNLQLRLHQRGKYTESEIINARLVVDNLWANLSSSEKEHFHNFRPSNFDYEPSRKTSSWRAAMVAVLAIGLLLFGGQAVQADHIPQPNFSEEEVADKYVSGGTSDAWGCILRRAKYELSETESWSVFEIDGKVANLDYLHKGKDGVWRGQSWIDHDGDGHFDEMFYGDKAKLNSLVTGKYSSPCDMVKPQKKENKDDTPKSPDLPPGHPPIIS